MSPSFRNAVLLLALCAAASGCYAKPLLTRLAPTDQPVANYAIGETRRALPGGVMIERIEGLLLLPGYRQTQALTVPGLDKHAPPVQEIWAAHYQYSGVCQDGRYVLTSPKFYKERIGIVVADDGTVPCDQPVVQLGGTKVGRTWTVQEKAGVKAFSPTPFIAGKSGASRHWQITYAGRTGSEVSLEYRELDDIGYGIQTRATASQQVKYDLSASKVLNFHENKIEVLEASNTGITFRVLHDAGKARKISELWGESAAK